MNQKLIKAGSSYFVSLLKSQFKPVPVYVNLFYTRRCNLRCEFCSTIKRPAKRELTLDEWKKCSDILYGLGNRYISITGGEPLVRKDLPDFIRYLSQKTRLHSLVTNGVLLTEAKLKELAEAGLMHLGLSTQSLIPGKHVKSQRKELFDLLLAYQKKYGFEVSALITLTNENAKEASEMVDYLTRRGVNVAPNIVTSGQGEWWFRGDCPDLLFDRAGLKTLKQTINFLIKSNNITYSEKYLKDLYNYAQGKKPFNCEAGCYYFSINDDGYVMPCQDLAPTKAHYTQLKQNYPLIKPDCNDCMWPCYYEETYKRNHLLNYAFRLVKNVWNNRFR